MGSVNRSAQGPCWYGSCFYFRISRASGTIRPTADLERHNVTPFAARRTHLSHPSPEPSPTDEAAVLSEDIAAALGEGTLYIRLDAAAVWLVD